MTAEELDVDARKLLLKAADRVELGWTQRQMRATSGDVCAVGAIAWARQGDDVSAFWSVAAEPGAVRAVELLADRVSWRWRKRFACDPIRVVTSWNDSLSSITGQAEVVRVMREVGSQ